MIMSNPRVAVLGAGAMGCALAKRLGECGCRVTMYSRTVDKPGIPHTSLVELVDSPARAVVGADFIVSVLANDIASEEVWLGTTGAASACRAGTLCLEMSTLSHEYTTRWLRLMSDRGLAAVDCPVTGSVDGCLNGSLVAFVGAEENAHPELDLFLKIITCHMVYFDEPGSAMLFKLCFNSVGATMCAALAECFGTLRTYGINMERALEALLHGGWTTPVATAKGKSMVQRMYKPNHFRLSLMHKDLEYALQLRNGSSIQMPVAQTTKSVYQKAIDAGLGRADFAAVYEVYAVSEPSV
jgi:3-hydroxyisobutyrate dehydrogenase